MAVEISFLAGALQKGFHIGDNLLGKASNRLDGIARSTPRIQHIIKTFQLIRHVAHAGSVTQVEIMRMRRKPTLQIRNSERRADGRIDQYFPVAQQMKFRRS